MSQADSPNTTSPSRRRVLAGISVAAAPMVAAVDKSLGAIVPGADPIFAAIRREQDARAACRAADAALSRLEWRLERRFPDDAIVDATWCAKHRYDEVEAAAGAATQAWWEAQEALLQTQPTSVPGLFALLDHLERIEQDEWIDEWAVLAFPTIAASIRSLMGSCAVGADA
jgi:hypothetical protein